MKDCQQERLWTAPCQFLVGINLKPWESLITEKNFQASNIACKACVAIDCDKLSETKDDFSDTVSTSIFLDDIDVLSCGSDRHSVYLQFDDISVLTTDSSMELIDQDFLDTEDSEENLAAIFAFLTEAFHLKEEEPGHVETKPLVTKATEDIQLMSFLLEFCTKPSNE